MKMCDTETRVRLEKIDAKIEVVMTDVAWLKRITATLVFLMAAAYGIHLQGVLV